MNEATDEERRYEELLGALLLAHETALAQPEKWQQGEYMLGAVRAILDRHGAESKEEAL